jgi:hypothetical protein
MGDLLYRTADGGMTFAPVLATTLPISAVVIGNDGVIVSSGEAGTFRATDGIAFSALAGAPQLSCLGTRSDGSYLGCGTNWDPDFMAVARSSDLGSWGKLFRFVELAGPLECPQINECGEAWTTLKAQFGATGPSCGISEPPPPPDDKGGCCDAGTGAPWVNLGLGLGLALLALRKRRA